MVTAIELYPRFDSGSSFGQFQQISNFSVTHLEGFLISLMHMDIPPDRLEKDPQSYRLLQQKMLKRERTVKHAFQFQIEKRFSDFKSIHRTRLHTSRSSDWLKLGLAGQNSSRIQDIVETISKKFHNQHGNRLLVLDKRLKTLVHRSDGSLDDNPISPSGLCGAFLSSIEILNLTVLKIRQLFELFDIILEQQLDNFYIQIDLGMYHLNLLPELTDNALFLQPEEIKAEDENDKLEVDDEAIVLLKDRALKSIRKRISDNRNSKQAVQELQKFKLATAKGSLEYLNLFAQFESGIKPFINPREKSEICRFSSFYTSLLDNPLLRTPLKEQLSRLAYPLVELVLIDPFFFRSSSHPVNDFLQSIIDFEIRYTHKQDDLTFLADKIDNMLSHDKPVLSDFQPVITAYETYKQQKLGNLHGARELQQISNQKLKQDILQTVNEITEYLDVSSETLIFFYDDWHLLLLQVARKIGIDSSEFKQSIEIAKILAWSLHDKTTDKRHEYQKYSFASLLKAINKGLVALNFSREHRHRVRKQLVSDFKQNNTKASFKVIPSASSNPLQKFNHFSTMVSSNVTRLTDINVANPRANSEGPGISSDDLMMGAWVEINTDKKRHFKPAKLKWKAVNNSLFIFIDQRGHKILECSQKILDEKLVGGSVKLLNNPSPFGHSGQTLGSGFKCYVRK